MFKNKKVIYGLAGFVVVLAILSFVFNNLSNNRQTALARQADVILTAPAAVPFNSTTPVTVYFSYGNPNGDLDIVNAIASLSLSNSNFTIVPSSIQDLYFGSPLRTDAQNPPAQPTCNSSYTGPVYALSSSLATTSSMTYGLQSARNSSGASGTATAGPLPGGANGLREKATGCIKVDFLVAPNLPVDSTTVVTFDEDSTLSTSYQENRRPGRQIVTLTGLAGTVSTANTTATAGTATSTATSGTATATATSGTATSTATSGTATSTATSGTATSTATSGTATATSGTATSTAGTATSTSTAGTATSTATAGTATSTATSATATSGTATSTATSGTATATSTATSGTATSTATSGTATATATSGTTGATATSGTTGATTATSSATGTTTTPRTGGNSIVLSILGISAAMISGIAFYYSRKSKLSKKINISK